MPSVNNNSKQFDVLSKKYQNFKNNTAPRLAAKQAVLFFKRNFELQGFVDKGLDKWKPLSNPRDKARKILRKRGVLKNSIRELSITKGKIIIGVPSDVKYAAIHNYGGQIKITPKMRRYFWAMYKQTKEVYYKNMALSKKEFITIPERKFIGDSEGLVKNVDRMLIKELQLALK